MINAGSTKDPAPSDSVGHLVVHLDDQHPAEVSFLFEQQRGRMPKAMGFSVLSHAAFLVLAVLVVRYAPRTFTPEDLQKFPIARDIIWLNQPGPGGGGGGVGNRSLTPPRKAELPGRDKLTVPVTKPPELTRPDEKPKDEPKPDEQLNIPAKTTAVGEVTLPGALQGTTALNSTSLGPGTGGGAYRPGNGIEPPVLVKEVKPQYTPEAMRAKIQGSVWLECVVIPEGVCTDFQVTRSLDPVFGLDQEAIKAARQWRFIPGKRLGQPVPVVVSIELNFGLR